MNRVAGSFRRAIEGRIAIMIGVLATGALLFTVPALCLRTLSGRGQGYAVCTNVLGLRNVVRPWDILAVPGYPVSIALVSFSILTLIIAPTLKRLLRKEDIEQPGSTE